MVRPLSEQLSDLSVHAKNAEDAVAAAKKEAHDKIVARRDQSRADVNAAIEQVNGFIFARAHQQVRVRERQLIGKDQWSGRSQIIIIVVQ